ncbi:hypothetical protein H109_05718 [Trichophyton interdigitale MR816]|uniref:Methyltransferase domain-containing protein n=1 Tax=Trichophyton interdigitale (strain MR816) TaxID=1215338 RepID=A0A059J3D1_TRIIM|nr:hypothetical protein H109_05718 [Trichophyton interdigitale MR816]
MATEADDRSDECSQSTIEADANAEQTSTIATDFASVVSTIPNFVYENGRRYQGYCVDQYFLPNDEREQERLDFLHQIFRLTLDGELCFTKLDNPERILDIGTGTGIWAIESKSPSSIYLTDSVAELYPSAQVVGTDISPIQPSWRPDNVEFMMDDAEQDWTFPESSFDFIHIRTLGGSVSDWPRLMGQCYKRLKPGGRIEVSEARAHFCCDDDTFPEDSKTRHWLNEFDRISHSCGREFDVFPFFAGWLQDGGFIEVEEMEKVMPLGTWPKDKKLKMRGRYFMAQFLGHAMESYSTSLFTRVGGWSADDLWKLLNNVTEEVRSNKMHIYSHFSFAIAKKPD